MKNLKFIYYIYIYIRYKYEEETTMYFGVISFFKDDANVCECVNKKKKILLKLIVNTCFIRS